MAVILYGCGVYDGAEIHEGAHPPCPCERRSQGYLCRPNIEQREVINHSNGSVQEEEYRNVLEESARIARGEISQLMHWIYLASMPLYSWVVLALQKIFPVLPLMVRPTMLIL